MNRSDLGILERRELMGVRLARRGGEKQRQVDRGFRFDRPRARRRDVLLWLSSSVSFLLCVFPSLCLSLSWPRSSCPFSSSSVPPSEAVSRTHGIRRHRNPRESLKTPLCL
jgi:hypothetical protein